MAQIRERVARGADHDPRRLRLLPRGDHGLVRGARCRLRAGPGAQRAAARDDRGELARRRCSFAATGRAGAGLRRARVPHARDLEPRAAGGGARPSTSRQGATRASWSRRCPSAEIDARALVRRGSTAPAATWRTGSRSSSSTCSPTASARQTMRANQVRLYFSSIAYVLMQALRRLGLAGTELERAQCGTIRLKLLEDRRADPHQRAARVGRADRRRFRCKNSSRTCSQRARRTDGRRLIRR